MLKSLEKFICYQGNGPMLCHNEKTLILTNLFSLKHPIYRGLFELDREQIHQINFFGRYQYDHNQNYFAGAKATIIASSLHLNNGDDYFSALCAAFAGKNAERLALYEVAVRSRLRSTLIFKELREKTGWFQRDFDEELEHLTNDIQRLQRQSGMFPQGKHL